MISFNPRTMGKLLAHPGGLGPDLDASGDHRVAQPLCLALEVLHRPARSAGEKEAARQEEHRRGTKREQDDPEGGAMRLAGLDGEIPTRVPSQPRGALELDDQPLGLVAEGAESSAHLVLRRGGLGEIVALGSALHCCLLQVGDSFEPLLQMLGGGFPCPLLLVLLGG